MNLKNDRYHVLTSFNENVYLVQDQLTTCLYVAKRCGCQQSERYKHQFRVEIDILSKLKSTYVPLLVDVFNEGQDEFLIQTYIEGMNLKKFLCTKKWMFSKAKIVFSMISILQEIHALGYLYIDLKPENIIVYKNHYYLIDFNACIEINSRIAIMASKSNCAPELFTLEIKDERVDVYALGSLIQTLYPHQMKWLVYLCHKKKNGRIQSLKAVKFLFCLKYFFSILIVCILSVFLYKNTLETKTVFDVYYQTHNISLFQKAYRSSEKKERLYTWIMNDWIIDEVYTDEQASIFLMKEAIKTQDASIIQFVYKKVNLKAYPEIEAQALMYIHPNVQTINRCIEITVKSALLNKEKVYILDHCILTALNNEFLIDIESILNWITSQKVTIQYETLGCDYLEYVFLVKKEEDRMIDIPEIFIETFESERWNELYTFWRTLT